MTVSPGSGTTRIEAISTRSAVTWGWRWSRRAARDSSDSAMAAQVIVAVEAQTPAAVRVGHVAIGGARDARRARGAAPVAARRQVVGTAGQRVGLERHLREGDQRPQPASRAGLGRIGRVEAAVAAGRVAGRRQHGQLGEDLAKGRNEGPAAAHPRQRADGVDHVHVGRDDGAEDREALVDRVEERVRVREVDEELAGGAVHLPADAGHGEGAPQVGLAGLVHHRRVAQDAREGVGVGVVRVAPGLDHEGVHRAVHEGAVVAPALQVGQEVVDRARRDVRPQLHRDRPEGGVDLHLQGVGQARIDRARPGRSGRRHRQDQAESQAEKHAETKREQHPHPQPRHPHPHLPHRPHANAIRGRPDRKKADPRGCPRTLRTGSRRQSERTRERTSAAAQRFSRAEPTRAPRPRPVVWHEACSSYRHARMDGRETGRWR